MQFFFKCCWNFFETLLKSCANFVENLIKFCSNFVQFCSNFVQFALNFAQILSNFDPILFKFCSNFVQFWSNIKSVLSMYLFLLIHIQTYSIFEISLNFEKNFEMNFLRLMIAIATYRIATFHVRSKSDCVMKALHVCKQADYKWLLKTLEIQVSQS